MDTRKKTYLILLSLVVMFNFFFWGEKLGLNLLIFLFASAIAAITLNEENIKSKNVIASLASVLFSGAMVIITNSEFAVFSAITSFLIFMGFVHQPKLKTVFSAVFTSISSIVIFPYNFITELSYSSGRYKPVRTILKITKLVFIPVIFFIIFYSIYAYSNPVFNSYSVSFWDKVGEYLYDIFKDYPVLRFFYIFFGLVLITGLLFNRNINAFKDLDQSFLDTLFRNKEFKVHSSSKPRQKRNILYEMFSYRFKPNTLKLEYRMGLIFVFMMNALLVLLNIIDIQFTWIGFDPVHVDNLAYYVHNGTYMLIFSIVMSMLLLLYFFRGNQNFYTKNKFLKFGAYFWIVQNAFMALSVGLRNLYYIEYYYALSYKRIGVMIFLLLTITGLVTMWIKIHERKTTYWLLKVNSTAAFIVLMLMSSYSWDKAIAEFNLSNPDKKAVDVEYLIRLSDDSLPVLDKHRDVLDQEYFISRQFYGPTENGLVEYNGKVENFIAEQNRYSWLSWNLADHNTLKYY